MLSIIVALVYLLAGIALYRHWPTDHRILWWTILVSVVLMAWTKSTIKTAMSMAVHELADAAFDGDFELATAAKPWVGDRVTNFWTAANFVITLVTLVVSVIGLCVPSV